MPKYRDRQLHHLKSSQIRVGKGVPRNDEGFDGDLALRVTNTGLKLFAKYRNKWYIIGEHLKEIGGGREEVNSSAGKVSPGNKTRISNSGDLQLQSGRDISFNGNRNNLLLGEDKSSSLPTNNKNLRLEANGRTLQYWFENASASWVTAGSGTHPASFAAQNLIFDYTVLGSSDYNMQKAGSNLQWEINGVNAIDMTATGLSVGANKRMTLTDNEIDVSSGDLTIDVAGSIIVDTDGGSFSINDSNPTAYYPSLNLTSTDAGAAGPIQVFKQDSASPAIGDVLGEIFFQGDDSGGNITGYGSIRGMIESPTGGSEEGKIVFSVMDGSTSQIGYQMTGDDGKVNVNVGYGTASVTTVAGDLDIDGDAITSAGALTVDSGGSITLDAHDGNFIAKKAGTEFSVANSAYAGMILGYTTLGRDATPAKYDVLASMNPVHDDMKVTFKAPPSGVVEVMASITVDFDASARHLTLGLSTTNATTGFTSLDAQYENWATIGASTETYVLTHRWVVTGLTAGAVDTYWFAAGAAQAGRIDLRWGGDSSAVADGTEASEYAPFIMKVTALPAATTDYAVYG